MNKLTTALAVSTIAFVSLQSNDAQADVPCCSAGCGSVAWLSARTRHQTNLCNDNERRIRQPNLLITTGTLGCDVGGSGSAKIFIQSNREAVAKDMSRGSGDTLNSLAEIGGCSNPDALSSYLHRLDLGLYRRHGQ